MAAVEVARATGCQLVVDVLHHVRVGAGAHELDVIAAAGVLGWLQLCDAAGELDATRRTAQAALLHEARHGRLAPGQGELPLQTLLASVPAGTVVSVEVQSDQLLAVPAADRARLLHDAARVVLGG